jgi:hypothetical protein
LRRFRSLSRPVEGHINPSIYRVLGVKESEREVSHPPPTGAELTFEWCRISASPHVCMAWPLRAHKKSSLLQWHR